MSPEQRATTCDASASLEVVCDALIQISDFISELNATAIVANEPRSGTLDDLTKAVWNLRWELGLIGGYTAGFDMNHRGICACSRDLELEAAE